MLMETITKTEDLSRSLRLCFVCSEFGCSLKIGVDVKSV
jgi:hypothetical protein